MLFIRLAVALCVVSSPALATPVAQKGYVQTADGVSIYYEKYGSGSQTIIVPNRLFMPEIPDALARPERTLILYDMRNRGLSRRVADASKLTILGDVDDLEAIRRHFKAEKISLVGYSYLGLMIALYATLHSDRVERLVQIGPVPRKFGTAYPADQRGSSDTLSVEGKAASEAWNRAREAATPASNQRELCRLQYRAIAYALVGNPANHSKVPDPCIYENELPANSQRHLAANFGDIQKRDFPREPFTALPQPVLTIHGTDDRNAPYGAGVEWAATFRNGRLITIPGGAHQVWLDDPAVLNDVDTFLRGSWPARAQGFGRE